METYKWHDMVDVMNMAFKISGEYFMANKKKRTLDEVEQLLAQRLDNHSRFADQLASKVFSLESAVASNEQDIRDRLTALEQKHCDHDYEITGGCVSKKNTLGCFKKYVSLKCTRCGAETREFIEKPGEQPKKSAWKRFTLFFRWGND
jgi:hypothetical protein